MTLDETIKYYEEKAELYMSSARSKEYYNLNAAHADREYAERYKQLSEWLKELEAYREAKERIKRGLQTCYNMVHCNSNHDILKGQERAFEYCVEQLEVTDEK